MNLIKYLLPLIAVFALAACSDDEPSNPDNPNQDTPSNPSDYGKISDDYLVATGSYIDLQPFSATVLASSAFAEIDASSEKYQLGVVFSSTNETPTIQDSFIRTEEPGNKYKTILYALKAEETYFYRACLYLNGNVYYAKETRSFSTPGIDLNIGEATEIGSYGASFTCTFDASKFRTTEFSCGILVSTNEVPLKDNGTFFYTPELNGNSYTVSAYNLIPNKTYYCRACIKSNGYYYYSKQIRSFVTSNINLQLSDITDISKFGATVSYTVDPAIPSNSEPAIIISLEETPTLENGQYVRGSVYVDETIKAKLGNQIPGKTYYVRACLKFNDDFILSSEIKSFKTDDIEISKPTIDYIKDMSAEIHFTFDKSHLNRDFSNIGVVFGIEKPLAFTNESYQSAFYGYDKTLYTAIPTNLKPLTNYFCAPALRFNQSYAYDDYVSGKTIDYIGQVVSFTTLPLIGGEPVDLGLPSGTKWAAMNIGASKSSDYGNKYAWGETATKENYGSDNSIYEGWQLTKLRSYGVVDSYNNLTEGYDAASVVWSKRWKMPTYSQCEELGKLCTWTAASENGVNGYKVTGPNGNSIFLPNSHYWQSTAHANTRGEATVSFFSVGPNASSLGWFIAENFIARIGSGLPIRAVAK